MFTLFRRILDQPKTERLRHFLLPEFVHLFQLLTLWKWIWIQVGRSAKIFCSTFRNNRSQDRCRPQLIEGLGIQELPPGKDFPLNLRQLRFVADLLPMPDNRVDCAVHDCASLARLQVKLFSGSKASRKARPAVRLRNQHRLIGLIFRPNLRGEVVGGGQRQHSGNGYAAKRPFEFLGSRM